MRSASNDHDQIQDWWRQEPDANIAVACRQSGLLALDVDERHAGDDRLHDLEQELGPLPDTPRSITGGGGCHILFKNPYKATPNRIAEGIDVRDRAYIIVPYSTHASGRAYEWKIAPEDVALGQLPQPWLERLTRTPLDRPYRDTGPIYEGERNNIIIRIAGSMRRLGLGKDAIESALSITNQQRCKPPLDPREIRKIVRWVAKQQPEQLWFLDPLKFAHNTGKDLTSNELLVFVAICHRANYEGKTIGGEWIQRETRLSKSTVLRAIRDLEGNEVIRVHRSKGGGKNRPNIYRVAAPSVQASPGKSPRSSSTTGVTQTPLRGSGR